MRHAEVILVTITIAGAATSKVMQVVDMSTTFGAAASLGAGLLSVGVTGLCVCITSATNRASRSR